MLLPSTLAPASARPQSSDPIRDALQRIVRGVTVATGLRYAEILLFADRLADFGAHHGTLPSARPDLRLLCARVPADHGAGVFSVPDLHAEPGFEAAAPSGTRFFAYAPITGTHGRTYGALVVLDPSPRWLGHEEGAHLDDFAAVASALLDSAAAAGTARATETAFAAAHAHLRTLTGLVSDAVLLFEGGLLIDANPAAARLFGLDHPGPLLGRPASELVEPVGADAFQDRCDGMAPGTFDLVLSDGEARPVQMRAHAASIPHPTRPLYLVAARRA